MAGHQNGAPTSSTSHAPISYPLGRPASAGTWTPELDTRLRAQESSTIQSKPSSSTAAPYIPRAFWPGGDRSLSAVALRAFLLGGGSILGFCLAIALFYFRESRLWRPAFFIAVLCLFHFLEFYMTAEYNTPGAFVSSFLLANGSRYRQAHTIAFLETTITSYLLPQWQARMNPPVMVALGIFLIIMGQAVRSAAMKQAGTNFNHMVQSKKQEGHELVTDGLYAYLRHPAYFGFFWWGLGTQLALGNSMSLVGYAGVLWWFFKTRIVHEERHLIEFFGDDYRAYRARTRVGIPFI